MIQLWYTKVKLGYNEITDVPERYYRQVLEKLTSDGLYDNQGNKIVAQ